MTFLAPLLLAGLAALAIPVVIHLTHRERRDPIPFPSLMFLRRVPFRTSRRQRIRHWILFLLRAAAVVAVVLAFARPLLEGAAIGGAGAGSAREVVVLLDRSSSMQYGDRWTRAVDAVRTVIDGLGPDDRITLVGFSDRPEALNQPTADPAALAALVGGLAPEAGGTRYAPALQLARDLLDQSDYPRREAVLITDFQRRGWDGRADVRLPAGVTVAHVDLSDEAPANRSVTHVLLDRSPDDGGRVTVSARITSVGAAPRSDLRLDLELGGQVIQTRSVAVAADGSALVRFAPVAIPVGATPARVVMAGDALPADDAYRFLLRPIPRIPVLVVEHPSARDAETLYLRRALGIGRDPTFDVRVRRTSRIRAEDLADRTVVILNDAPFPGGDAGQRLTRFVESGGGLLAVFGQRSGTLPSALRDSAGGPTGAPVDRLGDRGATMSIADYTHPALQPFAAPRSGDFSATRFFRYRRLTEPPGGQVLARLDDGGPALTEAPVGEGRAMLWASGLANGWNDLPVQPVFLPFIHQVVRHLAAFVEPPSAFTAGQVFDLATLDLAGGTELVVETPAGARSAETVGDGRRHVELRESGFYAIRPLERSAGPVFTIPVNPDLVESDLTAIDPEELLAGFRPIDRPTEAAAELAALGPMEQERRQRLWWYLLFGVLLLLAAESIAAGRASRVAG